MKPRRPRVTAIERSEHEFFGRFKSHEIDIERDSYDANWYIRVRHPDGCYVYDGWWQESRCHSLDDAILEACKGSCLVDTPKGGA